MADKKKIKLWAIMGEEESPRALTLAKTRGGALKKYEEYSGRTRYGLHVEEVTFGDGCFVFSSST
jgi:hypothetical protein